MILDEFTEFADAVTVAHAAGTVLLGDVIDTQVVRDLGNGQEIFLVITVDTGITVASSTGTIQFSLVSDAQAAIAVDGSATVHYTSQAFATAPTATALAAGKIIVKVALPWEDPAYERYLGVLYTVATTTTNAGKVNAFLTPTPAGTKAYPAGSN